MFPSRNEALTRPKKEVDITQVAGAIDWMQLFQARKTNLQNQKASRKEGTLGDGVTPNGPDTSSRGD